MIHAGRTEILPFQAGAILTVLVVVAGALIIGARMRRFRRSSRTSQVSLDRPIGVEIPYSAFVALEATLEAGPIGDGRDAKGRPFAIRRYRSTKTGKLYDCVTTPGERTSRVIEYSPPLR